MRDNEETIDIADARCIKETEKALLCEIDGKQEWVPKSQIHDDSEVYQEGDEGHLVVSEWIAKQKGWI